jgi:hypothetical protein
MSALNALLTGLVDFAGIFPPAGLEMRSAVRAYSAYRLGPHASVLGSFVVPAARLDEFGAELEALCGSEQPERPWAVSVLAGDAADADVSRALTFAASGERGTAIQVVSIDVKADTAAGVARATAIVPRAMTMAVEIPLSLRRENRRSVLRAVRAAGRMVKLRTGGVTAEAIPSPVQVAEFIWDCARAGVAFKATAGLHHPVRAEQRLTYAADSPRATMHGFLNVFLASAAAWVAAQSAKAEETAAPPAAVIGLLEEQDPSSFRFDAAALRWRGAVITAADIAGTRAGLARSFGSCSFVEPVSELEALGWLPQQQPAGTVSNTAAAP